MEIIVQITSIIVAAISAGLLTSLITRKQDKKAKEIQNESSAVEVWKELLQRSDDELSKNKDKIEKLTLDKESLMKENERLELENESLTWNKCIVNGCKKRQPPRDFSKLT